MGSGASETQGWVTRDGVSRERGDERIHPPAPPSRGDFLIGWWLKVGSFFQGKDCVFPLNHHQCPAQRGPPPCVMGHCTHVFTPLAPLKRGLFDRWVVEGWFLFPRGRLRFSPKLPPTPGRALSPLEGGKGGEKTTHQCCTTSLRVTTRPDSDRKETK